MPLIPSSGYRATRSTQRHPQPLRLLQSLGLRFFWFLFFSVSFPPFCTCTGKHRAGVALGLCSFHPVHRVSRATLSKAGVAGLQRGATSRTPPLTCGPPGSPRTRVLSWWC